METKDCRHCKESIRANARICRHCHSSQHWVADQRDPRAQLLILAVFVAMAGFIFFDLGFFSFSEKPAPQLATRDVTTHFVETAEGTRAFVMGAIENESPTAGAGIWIRVKLLDDSGGLLDTLLVEPAGLIAPAQGTATFRVSSLVGAAPQQIARVEATVERSRAMGRWD